MKIFKANLSFETRSKIESLIKDGFAGKEIAKLIGYSYATVKKEFSRCNGYENYSAQAAHNDFLNKRKSQCGRIKISDDPQLIKEIQEKFNNGWGVAKLRTYYKMGNLRLHRILSVGFGESKITAVKTLEERIAALEMQIEILTDSLRGIHEQHNRKNN